MIDKSIVEFYPRFTVCSKEVLQEVSFEIVQISKSIGWFIEIMEIRKVHLL